MNVRTLGLSALLVGVTAPLAAQQSGTIELGAFGRRTWFDRSYDLTNAIGVGGRLGFFVVRNVELEADASYNPGAFHIQSAKKAGQLALHGRLLYNIPVGTSGAFIIGGGAAYNTYGRDASGHETGPGALAGIRLGLGERASIRLDGTYDLFSKPDPQLSSAPNAGHWGLQVGLSLLSGNRHREAPAPVATPTPAPAPAPVAAPAPTDSDNDGVLDTADKCPNTPAGDKVDANGCSLPKDSDGDGVMDNVDKCPNTPAGDKVDATGCSLPKDSDNDGVNDDKDRCPNTPAGLKVDANGCRILFDEGSKTKTLILQGVNFETGKSMLLPESEAILKDVAASLVANSEIRVQVQGHTDSRGSLALNRRLSRARAVAVRDFLTQNGVAADRMTAKGFGPAVPVATNKTVEGRAQNRRVQLRRLN